MREILPTNQLSGHPGAVHSNVLDRLISSKTIDEADADKCREAIPGPLVTGDPPSVLATGRATYGEVTEAMSADGDEVIVAVPKMSADVAVTLCLLDTRAMPAAPFGRSIWAVAGSSSWWAGGQVD